MRKIRRGDAIARTSASPHGAGALARRYYASEGATSHARRGRPLGDPRGRKPGSAAGGRGRLLQQPPAGRGAGARGRRLGQGARRRAGPVRRRPAAAVLGAPGQREQAGAAHARPLRAPHRRGRVPPRVAQADGDGRGERAALAAVDLRAAGRARGPRGPLHDRDAGRGGLRLPDHDDLRGGARAARHPRPGGRVGAAGDRHHVRPAPDAGRARRARRSRAWR